MSGHERRHFDTAGCCECMCPACTLDIEDDGVQCVCPDCDAETCGLHRVTNGAR